MKLLNYNNGARFRTCRFLAQLQKPVKTNDGTLLNFTTLISGTYKIYHRESSNQTKNFYWNSDKDLKNRKLLKTTRFYFL